VVIALAVASISCGGGGGDKTTSPSATNNDGTGGMMTTPYSVGVFDNEFTPASLTVAIGTTVTWNFHGSYSAHNVTLDNGSGTSGDMMTGAYTRTFNVAGTYPYRCSIHGAAMTGTIIGQ